MIRSILSISDFELAMERSFLLYLKNKIPYVMVSDEQIDVQIMPPFPYEQYENFRLKGAVVTVALSRILQEGWHLGTEIDSGAFTGNTATDVHVPFRYDIQFGINCYTSNAAQRAKLDGAMLEAFYGLIRDGAPIYEFASETSATTAYDTGSRVTMTAVNQVSRGRAEDVQHHDYLTNFTLNAKALYIFETLTSVVTAVSATSDIIY